MDITTTLNQIIALSIQDRIRLVQAILDSVAAERKIIPISQNSRSRN